MKRIIYLKAGHSINQPGAEIRDNHLYRTEFELNTAIVNVLVPELERNGFIVRVVPNDKDVEGSYHWVNTMTSKIDDGLALSIHNNCCNGEGAESYYYGHNWKSKSLAKKLIDAYCEETEQKNRGTKSDISTRFGELGWIRKTNIWALLIECGFIDSEKDMKLMTNNIERVARGLAMGICNVYGIEYEEPQNGEPEPDREAIKRQIIALVNTL